MSHTGGPLVDHLKPYRNIALCDYSVVTDGITVVKWTYLLSSFAKLPKLAWYEFSTLQ